MAKVFHIQREHLIQGPHSSLGPEVKRAEVVVDRAYEDPGGEA